MATAAPTTASTTSGSTAPTAVPTTSESTILFLTTTDFQPLVTGEEICASLGPIIQHIDAVIFKETETWEVHITNKDVATRLEVTGIRIRGRKIVLDQRYPGGTWVRVRGFPLETENTKVNMIFRDFGEIVSGPYHATWRGTNVKTGDRTMKIKLDRNIPLVLTTLEEKVRVTVRYKDQPQTCYTSGLIGHGQKDCNRETCAKKVQEPTPQEPTPQEKSASGRGKKRRRKRKKLIGAGHDEEAGGEEERCSSPEEKTLPDGFHFMPQAIPVYKSWKN